VIALHGKEYGIAGTELGQPCPQPVEHLLLHLAELFRLALLDEVAGEQHSLPGAGALAEFCQIVQEGPAEVRPEELLPRETKMEVREVQPRE
jgi:hypothetical protein